MNDCKTCLPEGLTKAFSVVEKRPLARLPWSSTEVTVTSSLSPPFANTVPAMIVRKSSYAQVSFCVTLERYRNNRMPYCVIGMILKTSDAILASDGAPRAGEGALRQVMAPLRLLMTAELEISEINNCHLKIFEKV